MRSPRHKVLIYSGGGFCGCIWEWNFCFWDGEGRFYAGFHSGCDGIKDEKDALEVVRVLKAKNLTYSQKMGNSRINEHTMLLDYTKKKDCGEITKWNASLVGAILRCLDEELQEEHRIFIKCHVCGKTGQDLDDFVPDEACHQGMASWHKSFQCNECKCEFSCTSCGEDYRDSQESLIMTDENCGPICEYCYRDKIKRETFYGTESLKAGNIRDAILYRDRILKMKIILERFLGEDEDGNPVEPVEKPMPVSDELTPNLLTV